MFNKTLCSTLSNRASGCLRVRCLDFSRCSKDSFSKLNGLRHLVVIIWRLPSRPDESALFRIQRRRHIGFCLQGNEYGHSRFPDGIWSRVRQGSIQQDGIDYHCLELKFKAFFACADANNADDTSSMVLHPRGTESLNRARRSRMNWWYGCRP